MRMIDMHCDTLWKLIDLDGQGDLMKNDCHINIPSMKKAGTVVQLFACFTKAADYKKKGGYDAAFVHVQDMVLIFKAAAGGGTVKIWHWHIRGMM